MRARLGLVVLLYACGRAAVEPPPGVVPFTPSAQFRTWWAVTESCSGRRGDFDAVRWYTLPTSSSFTLEGETVNGAWYAEGNRIVLGEYQQHDSPLVRHEMLHALLRHGGHPRSEFLDRCGDLVACIDQCVRDAGGPIDTSATAPIVAPSALTVTTALAPDPVSLSADSAYLPVVIGVTNTLPYAVRASVAPVTPGGDPAFWFSLTPTGGGQRIAGLGAQGDSYTYQWFAPAGAAGATRRFAFDYSKTLSDVLPGDYDVTGEFVDVASASVVLHVLP